MSRGGPSWSSIDHSDPPRLRGRRGSATNSAGHPGRHKRRARPTRCRPRCAPRTGRSGRTR
ncbi:hypothetical protein RSM1_04925 [Methylobacterium radiotolerans]|nr:hypothetical protein RSM1_04925 [Methylobacterium radiotolerans]